MGQAADSHTPKSNLSPTRIEVESHVVDFNSDKWVLGGNAEIVDYAGRKALTGTAYLEEVELLNGTIEVDFLTTGNRNFGG
ncbi:hypothetical protein ACFL6U_27915, partial [Planctomycetota bacterium]